MRDIKFRAWSILSGKMITQKSQGDYFEPNVDIRKFKDQSLSLNALLNNTDSLIPMQYTGLKDKNGVEIYEGDILSFDSDWDSHICTVGFYSCKFSFMREVKGDLGINDNCDLDDFLDGSGCDGYTVIGNIHQNPELIK